MSFNFDFWLQAFVRFVNGQCETPPVPPPHMRQPEPPKPAEPKPQMPPISPDNNTIKPEDIYIIPRLQDGGWHDPEPVKRITLTKEEAIAQGWRFRIKSKDRAKITHYLGMEKDIVIPSQIGQYVINEICAGVFEKAKINSAQIPETVRMLGKRCFAGSSVQKLVIASPVSEIPEQFASGCGRLAEVQIHHETVRIRRCAFEKCVSLKQFAIHPYYSARVAWGAFRESGLQAFSCSERSIICGAAFAQTPLWMRHKLLLLNIHGYEVVLVGRDALSLKMPAESVHFAEQSILNQKGSLHTLDCSQCPSVRFHSNAIEYTYSGNSGNSGTAEREPLTITVPERTEHFFFTGNTVVQYADGRPFPPFLNVVGEEGGETVYYLLTSKLPLYALHPNTENVRIRAKDDSCIFYASEAVRSRVLERITFEASLQKDTDAEEASLFAGEICHNLHFVSWKEAGEQVQVYLPSAALIGERVHWYLLKAFHGYYEQWDYRVFRSAVFDRIFKQQDNTGIQPKPLPPEDSWCWSWALCRREGVPVLKQRQKILLAADVLRSTPKLFPKRDMYRKYLLTHRRYALKLCAELPEEYAAFLQGFYEVNT